MVERHGKTWRYDFLKDSVRYKKGGYKSKSEAIQAEAGARTGARTINMDFLKLCTARLEELEIRRSKGHFQRNKVLFEGLMQRWGSFPTITTDDVEEYLKEIVKTSKNGKHKANVALRLIKALFNHGIKRNWFSFNPANGIDHFGIEKHSKYIPPIEDIEKVLALANEERKAYLTIVAFTLARVREINNLKWEDVNFKENYLVLRTRKAKNSNVAERKIPMTPTVREILSKMEPAGEYVFVNPTIRTR